MNFHKCAQPHCTRRIPMSRFVCRVHWQYVPQQLKRVLYGAYEVYQRAQNLGIAEAKAALSELRAVQRQVLKSIAPDDGRAA